MSDPDIDLSSDVPMAMAVPFHASEKIGTAAVTGLTTLPLATPYMSPLQLQTLRSQGFPPGLAQELGQTKATYPYRFWIVDNSGSMRSNDGHELRGEREKLVTISCTRWKELQGAVEYHADLARLLQAATVFRLLNDPGRNVGPQEFSVGEGNGKGIEQQVAEAHQIIERAEPQGVVSQ